MSHSNTTFKKGDFVLCDIKFGWYADECCTHGKIYKVLKIEKSGYSDGDIIIYIIDDFGQENGWSSSQFIKLKNVSKLEKLIYNIS